MALMVASPLMNPNLFVLTAGVMGLEMAILRTLASFILGAAAGYITGWYIKKYTVIPENFLRHRARFSVDQFSGKTSERTVRPFSGDTSWCNIWLLEFWLHWFLDCCITCSEIVLSYSPGLLWVTIVP